MTTSKLIYIRDQLEMEKIRYERLNDLLHIMHVYRVEKQTAGRDEYGNYSMSKRRVKYRALVENFLCTDVLDFVKTRDIRFSGTVHAVGSCSAGVSVSANEADLLFMIDIDGTLRDCEELPGYAKYQLSCSSLEKWKDCTTSEGYMMSRKMASLFYHYVEEALKSDLLTYNLAVSEDETSITPVVRLTGIGTIATTVTVAYSTTDIIDIDLVVAVSCKGLPPLATATWLQGKSSWPNSKSVEKIKESGFQLVSKAPYPLSEDEGTTLWRISFSLAETILLQDLDENIKAHGLCTKKCFVLMKFFRMGYLAPTERNVTPILKSYYLKVLLLFECHEYPDPNFWTSDKLAERFLSMYQRLYTMIDDKRIPDFFMPAVNIMTSPLDAIRSNLRCLLHQPEEALKTWKSNMNKKFLLLL
ncbi:putative nucleotidyltransferase MAB21L1 [Mercenaria mercenaria]|uniref:putative nucleotidyltransferase MAB21L1 n=1 Tax=Mercenaria mercenaria TaxID=6596 RepID=UPI00234F0098|nr:putative nucleotidyltransferase MAB21L1 [Mercenaria mercenaria]